VDDLVAHIDGSAILGQRKLDDLDGAIDAGAEAARRGAARRMVRGGRLRDELPIARVLFIVARDLLLI
jgi:hypothetical protein